MEIIVIGIIFSFWVMIYLVGVFNNEFLVYIDVVICIRDIYLLNIIGVFGIIENLYGIFRILIFVYSFNNNLINSGRVGNIYLCIWSDIIVGVFFVDVYFNVVIIVKWKFFWFCWNGFDSIVLIIKIKMIIIV